MEHTEARRAVGEDEVWWLEEPSGTAPAPLVCRKARDRATARWVLSTAPAPIGTHRAAVRRYTELALDAATRPDREVVVRALTAALDELIGFGTIIVLIDERTGAPEFAGGSSIGRRELAGMEECRRRGAPMVIWQAFTQNRIVVAHEWAARVLADDRLAPLRPFFRTGETAGWSFVAVPLALSSRRIGVMAWMIPSPAMVTVERVGLWWDLAAQTAVALAYAEAIRDARGSGRDRERQRLNEDLHDSVGQDVFALRMLAARTEHDAQQAQLPQVAEDAHELRALADRVGAGLHALIGERRRVRETLGLSQQLTGLAREMGARSGVEIRAEVGGEWDHLKPDCREAVVRIVQEALRNIEKHAHARTASLRLAQDTDAPDLLLIEVIDDGESFDPAAAGAAGFGLASIRERAAENGGSVELRTVPSTTLRVRLRPSFESDWDEVVRG